MDIHGKEMNDIVTVRVPPDIQIVDSKACKEMLIRRRLRIKEVNRYRRAYNTNLKDSIERVLLRKEYLEEKLYTIRIKNWTPIISRDALEFICGKL